MAKAKSCPSLGLENDQKNHMAYATIYHYCYHQAKPRAINLSHQNELCLSENHINCPIFLSDNRMILDNNKLQLSKIFGTSTASHYGTNTIYKRVISIITLMAIVLFTILLVLFIKNQVSLNNPTAQTNQNLSMGSFTNIKTKDFLLTPSPILINAYSFLELTLQALETSLMKGTPTFSPFVRTNQTPTRTLTSDQKLTEVVCVIPDGWIVYQVKSWDTLPWLSKWVRTPVEKLMEANCMTTQTLVVGQDLFLPYYPKIDTHTPTPSSTIDYVAPVSTRTNTIAPTFTPTRTIIPSPTKNPLILDTRTPTRTLAISLTPTSTFTIPPSATNTNPPTATFTSSPEPTLTPSPTDKKDD